MTISKELFLSILAMDSYNRNYGAGIDGLPVAQGKVGGASIWQDAEDLLKPPAEDQPAEGQIDSIKKNDYKSAGFYAVAYKVKAGTWAGLDRDVTVISYRGTDEFLGSDTTGGSDIRHGWLAGAVVKTSQVDWAINFYKEVVSIATPGKTVYNGPAADTIIVGHSLGGGLAEIVSLISGTPGFGFDRMPTAVLAAVLSAIGGDGTLYPDAFHGYSVKNEALQFVRNGDVQALFAGILAAIPYALPAGALLAFMAGMTAAMEAGIKSDAPLDSNSFFMSPIDLHMQDLYVLLRVRLKTSTDERYAAA